ncbi:MAG TPA: hypothetical protein VNA14_10140 [Mycobacteriales bacterium]|nr:hypothetical protein [Mycobacteriales bacterium]
MGLSRARVAALIALSLTGGVVRVAGAAPGAAPRALRCATTPAAAAPAPVPPAGFGACTEVRPGDLVNAHLGTTSKTCALGFFFRDRRGVVYASTGSECAPPFAFEEKITTWPAGRGPAAADGRQGNRIGEFAFRIAVGELQLALIRLDRAVPVNPQVCQYGGPIGIESAVTDDPTTLVMVGPQGGFATWDLSPYIKTEGSVLRPGLAHNGLHDKDVIIVTGETTAEEGMPVLTSDGKAVGIASSYSSDSNGPAGINVGIAVTRPAKPIAVAEKLLRTKLTMLTAPLL